MTEKPGVWRDATEADQNQIVKVKCKINGGYDWDCYEKARIVKLKNKWAVMDASDGRNDFSLYGVVQVFDEAPAASPEPEWQEPTVEMVGREVLAQFLDVDGLWASDSKGVLLCKFGYGEGKKLWSTHEQGVAWFYQCRVKLLDTTKAEEPKAEPVEQVKRGRYASIDEMIADVAPEMLEEYRREVNRGQKSAATDDGWRDAVWPDDWGMACRKGNQGPAIGYLIGYDPTDFETPWVYGVKTPYDPEEAAVGTCQVNDRLPRFVMPGGGK